MRGDPYAGKQDHVPAVLLFLVLGVLLVLVFGVFFLCAVMYAG
jgi:hypothetical protein